MLYVAPSGPLSASTRCPATMPEGDSVPHIDILVLAIVQGVTEFLPLGGSAHQLILSKLFCWLPMSPTIGLASQLGFILALVLYFWRDVLALGQGLMQVMKRKRDPRSRLLGYLLVAGLPAALVTVLLQMVLEGTTMELWLVATMVIFFALLLYAADRLGLTVRRVEHLNIGNALLIGLVQCFDVIPGVSRFGAAFTVGRFLGFERLEAARFSLLMGLPAGLVFVLYQIYLMIVSPMPLDSSGVGLAFICTTLSGFLAISFLMYWLRRSTVKPFVVYRLALGLYLFYLAAQLVVTNC